MTDDTQSTYPISSLIDEKAIEAILDQRRKKEEEDAQAVIAAFNEAILAILDEGDRMRDENFVQLYLTKKEAKAVTADPEASDADKKAAAANYRDAMQALANFIGDGYKAASPPMVMQATPVSTSAFVAENPEEERLLADYRAGKVRLETEQVLNDDSTVTVLSAWSDRGIYPIISARRVKRKSEKQASAVAPAAAKSAPTSSAADDNGSTAEPESPNVTAVPTPPAKPAPPKAAGTTKTTKRTKKAPAAAAPAATQDPTPPVDTPAPPAPVTDDNGSSEPESPVDIPAVVAPAATDPATADFEEVSAPSWASSPDDVQDTTAPADTGSPASWDLRSLAERAPDDNGSSEPEPPAGFPASTWGSPSPRDGSSEPRRDGSVPLSGTILEPDPIARLRGAVDRNDAAPAQPGLLARAGQSFSKHWNAGEPPKRQH